MCLETSLEGKRWVNSRIDGIQKAQGINFSHNLFLLEKDLIFEFNQILAQEEMLWFQKSRSKWITQGENNTRYFHLSTIIRRRKSKINMLKNDANIWVDDPSIMKEMVQNYFVNLFKDPNSNVGINQEMFPHPTLDSNDNARLSYPVTPIEVWNCMKNIQPYKAPGPDGIQAIFYQKHWNVVSEEICSFVQNCFITSTVPEEVNKTLVSLIPKVDNPDSIKMFRPISLCNVVYKVISKIIVDRLYPLLTRLLASFRVALYLGVLLMTISLSPRKSFTLLEVRKGKKVV